MVDRLRPCQIDETVSLIVKIPFDSSFPSGHTLNGITAAVTLMFIDKRMGIPAIVLAVLIAFFTHVQLHAFPNGCPGRSSAWGGIGCVCELFVLREPVINKKAVHMQVYETCIVYSFFM